MKFMPLLLAALALAVTFALFSASGAGSILGIQDTGAESVLEEQASEIELNESEEEEEEEEDGGGIFGVSFPGIEDMGLLGDVIKAVKMATGVAGMVIRMPTTLMTLGMPDYAARIFGHTFQIVGGLWIAQIIRGTELL